MPRRAPAHSTPSRTGRRSANHPTSVPATATLGGGRGSDVSSHDPQRRRLTFSGFRPRRIEGGRGTSRLGRPPGCPCRPLSSRVLFRRQQGPIVSSSKKLRGSSDVTPRVTTLRFAGKCCYPAHEATASGSGFSLTPTQTYSWGSVDSSRCRRQSIEAAIRSSRFISFSRSACEATSASSTRRMSALTSPVLGSDHAPDLAPRARRRLTSCRRAAGDLLDPGGELLELLRMLRVCISSASARSCSPRWRPSRSMVIRLRSSNSSRPDASPVTEPPVRGCASAAARRSSNAPRELRDSLRDLCGHLRLDPLVDEALKLRRPASARLRAASARSSSRSRPCHADIAVLQLGAEGIDRLRHLGARRHVLAEAVVEDAQPLRQGVELARDHRIGDRRALHLCELLADCVEVVGELVDALDRRRRRRQRRVPRSAM